MKRVVVTFGEPKDVRNPGEDGMRIRFPFSVVPEEKIGKPDERNHTSEHRITVRVADTTCAPWLQARANVSLVIFEAGRRQIEKVLKSGECQQSLEHSLTPPDYRGAAVPFDTSRIPNPLGFQMVVEVSPAIGFNQI